MCKSLKISKVWKLALTRIYRECFPRYNHYDANNEGIYLDTRYRFKIEHFMTPSCIIYLDSCQRLRYFRMEDYGTSG